MWRDSISRPMLTEGQKTVEQNAVFRWVSVRLVSLQNGATDRLGPVYPLGRFRC